MKRSLAAYGTVILVVGLVAYLFTHWDVLALTAIVLGVCMIGVHWAVAGTFRGPTVPR